MTGTGLWVGLFLTLANDPYVRLRVGSETPNAHCFWWGRTEVVYHQSSKGTARTRSETEFDAVRKAWNNWQAVSDGCGSLKLTEGERVADRQLGFTDALADNRNVVLFRDVDCQTAAPESSSCWPEGTCSNRHDCWDEDAETIALTYSTTDAQTGEILDTDIEMNAAWFVFTTVDAPVCAESNQHQGCVATDVENTVTHEVGHALGLDHTGRAGSTMLPKAQVGDLDMRSLDPGSAQFICDAYPKGRPAQDCVILPSPHGLGQRAGCASLPGSLPAYLPSLLGFAGVFSALRRRKGLR